MSRTRRSLALLAFLASLGRAGLAQSCPTYTPPPLEPGSPPVFDELHGTLALTFRRDVGLPGAYTSTLRVQGSVEGTNAAWAFRYLQLRVVETGTVYAAVPLPDSLGAAVPIGAGFRLLSASSPARTVQLVAASDDGPTPIWSVVLAELVLRTPDPQGSLTIPRPTCLRAEDGSPCTVDVEWESTNVASAYDHLYVTVESPVWPGRIWRALAPDVPGGSNSGNVKINAAGVTFRLIAANGVFQGHEYERLRAEGMELDAATATSLSADGVLSPVDGLPMRRRAQDPEAYLAVLANGMFKGVNPVQSIREAAVLLDAAGMHHVRRTIRWDKLARHPDGRYDFEDFYDGLFLAFSDAGVEPWITLSGMRSGAGDPSLGKCENAPEDAYPLAHAAEAAWVDFVTQVVARYGPGGEVPLALPCRNWEIWQEPQFALCGDFVQWRRLYDLARPVIRAFDPASRMWAPNVTLLDDPRKEVVDPVLLDSWIDDTLTSGLEFEGFALHTFFHHGEDRLRLAYRAVQSVRARIDAAFGAANVPLAVTACTHVTPFDAYGFRRLLEPEEQEQFYVDFVATLANGGADAAMWFDAVERTSSNCLLGPTQGASPYHQPNPVYCGAQRVSRWLASDE